jgi:predicted transcriptional regulator
MLVGEALNKKIAVLSIDDSLAQAEAKMDELGVNVLPVIDPMANEVIGQINRNDIAAAVGSERTISSLEMKKPVVIFKSQHLFQAVRKMLENETNLLPIVDHQSSFMGIIQKKQLLGLLVDMLNLTGHGSVVTIELGPKDFTISEIVQIIETEGAKIMGITVESPDREHENYEISIKLNLENVSRVAAALRRHEYTILTESKIETQTADLAMRADEFLQYLDM